jgi:hypothetical protein
MQPKDTTKVFKKSEQKGVPCRKFNFTKISHRFIVFAYKSYSVLVLFGTMISLKDDLQLFLDSNIKNDRDLNLTHVQSLLESRKKEQELFDTKVKSKRFCYFLAFTKLIVLHSFKRSRLKQEPFY